MRDYLMILIPLAYTAAMSLYWIFRCLEEEEEEL